MRAVSLQDNGILLCENETQQKTQPVGVEVIGELRQWSGLRVEFGAIFFRQLCNLQILWTWWAREIEDT